MLGSKSSTSSIYFSKANERKETIKKVDIDMFSTGELQEEVSKYVYITQKKDNIFEIDFKDDYTLYLKLIINVNLEEKDILYAKVDEDSNLTYQKDGDSLSADVFLEKPGSHSVTIITQDKLTNNKMKSAFNFFVREVKEVKSLNVDVPVDSYRNALLNATKLWLLSTSKDRVRRPDWAGFFDDHLRRFKMNEEGAAQVEKELSDKLQEQMPNIYISEIKATPLLNERAWDVSVVSTDLDTGITTKRETTENHIKISQDENIKDVSDA